MPVYKNAVGTLIIDENTSTLVDLNGSMVPTDILIRNLNGVVRILADGDPVFYARIVVLNLRHKIPVQSNYVRKQHRITATESDDALMDTPSIDPRSVHAHVGEEHCPVRFYFQFGVRAADMGIAQHDFIAGIASDSDDIHDSGWL